MFILKESFKKSPFLFYINSLKTWSLDDDLQMVAILIPLILFKCKLSRTGASLVLKSNKPNQIFLQALNKGHTPKREEKHSTVNKYLICYTCLFAFFSNSFIFQKYCQLDYNTSELFFHTYLSHIHACTRQ